MSKALCVRIPDSERVAVESLLANFPGASPALVIRALLHSAKPIQVRNALAKLAASTVKGGRM